MAPADDAVSAGTRTLRRPQAAAGAWDRVEYSQDVSIVANFVYRYQEHHSLRARHVVDLPAQAGKAAEPAVEWHTMQDLSSSADPS